MKKIKDLCRVMDCCGTKYIYNGYDNTIEEFDDRLQKSLNDANSVYSNEYFTEVDCEYDVAEIRMRASNRLSHAIIGITDECNLRCKYCGYHDTRYKDNTILKNIGKDTLKYAIDFIFTHSVDAYETGISFYGGEPLLCFDLIKFTVDYLGCRNIRGHKYNYSITTNGTLLDTDVLDFFVANDVLCTISLDGPAFIHDKYRVYNDNTHSYADVIKNLKKIASKYPKYYEKKITYQAVVSPPFNIKTIADYFEKSEVRFIDVSIGNHFKKLLEAEYGSDWKTFEVKGNNGSVPRQLGDIGILLCTWFLLNAFMSSVPRSDVPIFRNPDAIYTISGLLAVIVLTIEDIRLMLNGYNNFNRWFYLRTSAVVGSVATVIIWLVA